MQEINRAAALLGPKVQECNTRDKQELGAPCLLDQTIRLLSSQTVCSLAGRTMLRALGYPHLHWSKQPRLASRKFIVISSSRSFQAIWSTTGCSSAPRTGPAADRRPSRKSCAEPRFAGDDRIGVGAVAYVAGVETWPAHGCRHLTVKLAPITN